VLALEESARAWDCSYSCIVALLLSCRHLDRHLDADEAVVLGAGLFAANLSSSFRLRVSAADRLIALCVASRWESPSW
jgi:hypothetical protein